MPPPCIIYSATACNKSSSISDWLAVSKRGYWLHGKDARSSHITPYLLCYPFLWSISPREPPKMQGAGITQLLSSAAKSTVCADDTEDVAVVVPSCSHVWLFATPWTAACQPSLSFTISRSLFRLMSIALMMPSSHLILWCPLLLVPSIFPSIRSFPRSQLFPSDDPNSLNVWMTQKMYHDAI